MRIAFQAVGTAWAKALRQARASAGHRVVHGIFVQACPPQRSGGGYRQAHEGRHLHEDTLHRKSCEPGSATELDLNSTSTTS